MHKSYEDPTRKCSWAAVRITAGTTGNDCLPGWFLETEIKYALQENQLKHSTSKPLYNSSYLHYDANNMFYSPSQSKN